MSITNGQHGWPPPLSAQVNGGRMLHSNYHQNAAEDGLHRTQTPSDSQHTLPLGLMPEASDLDEDHRRAHFQDRFRQADRRLTLLFGDDGGYNQAAIASFTRPPTPPAPLLPAATDHAPIHEPPRKRAKRVIDEDDYGDDDEDEDDEDNADGVAQSTSPIISKSRNAAAAKTLLSPSKSGSSPVHSVPSPGRQGERSREDGSQIRVKTSEDARKELEEARTATEDAARRSFHTLFYTLENDRTAMLEHQQLEESEKRLQAEMDKTGQSNTNQTGPGHSSLSNANLGASSLTLKHLIARIDLKREKVAASDAELRSLMNEVRKNRSKWASEENVGQEELYEALEKVLSELKAHTEYSTPFLNRVNKRDAPDYYNIIKHPMDLGSMTKKLKALTYKSKTEFVSDLNLIWDNCLRYNQDMHHPFRRLANSMRKEAEKLIPLIPDLVIRPRAEVEAEERRKQNGGEDDDSDDEPIMSSRGRKATKGTNKSRKAPSDQKEGTPNVDQKPLLQLNGLFKTYREGSEIDGSNGFATPPIAGSLTPGGMNGHSGVSNGDAMDIDGPSLNGIVLNQALGDAAEQAYEDEEYKIWKQVTKKDRALIAKERYRLFADGKLNVNEAALLRTKAGMRRYLKARREAEAQGILPSSHADASAPGTKDGARAPETLAEGMEDEIERNVPAYYEPQTIIPDINPKLQWIEDGEGQVINQFEDMLQLVPPGLFISPVSKLTQKFDANIRQLQETRKLCSKISVIKQMQIQTQVYQNQFQKYNPEPFVEQDIEPAFIAGEGPVMAGEVCRSAMQRSVAKIFYHAGFEELQPSALDTITDIAGDYFQKLVHTFNVYFEAEKKPATSIYVERGARFQHRYTPEEIILHTLDENGHDVESLENYARDEVDRLGAKLGQLHERMKAHLADLLRPALNGDAGADGSGAFNDGSEQFVGGDFAEDLGEDFFGFKSLGLDKELGLDMLSVPLHLLQSRVRNQFQLQTAAPGAATADVFLPLAPQEPVTKESIQDEIGLVKNFFLAKLHANSDQPLVEDEDLPIKQRRPRPRLGASGKIVSPQKRPPKEQLALAKKKKKLENGMAQITDGKNAVAGAGGPVLPSNSTSPNKSKKAAGGALGQARNNSLNQTLAPAPAPTPPGPTPAPVPAGPPTGGSIHVSVGVGSGNDTDKDDTGGSSFGGGANGVGMMSPESVDVR